MNVSRLVVVVVVLLYILVLVILAVNCRNGSKLTWTLNRQNKICVFCTCSRAERSDEPLMLLWEGDGDGGLWCGLWCGCCSCCCCCWYLLLRWSMKASLLRSMSALCRLVSASRLCAAVTVCRCSDVCTRPTLENLRAFPNVRYSRGYSKSSVEIMWVPPRSGSDERRQEREKGREKRGEGGRGCRRMWITSHTSMQKIYTHTNKWSRKRRNKVQRGKGRRQREMGWDVRLFTTRTEWFLT